MPITFVCPQCGRSGKAPDGFQGSRIKCPACQAISPFDLGGNADSTIPLVELPREVPKPPPVPRPKPVMQPAEEEEEEEASRVPMGLMIAGASVAVVLVLGVGLAFLFKPWAVARPPVPAAVGQDPGGVSSQGPGVSSPFPLVTAPE